MSNASRTEERAAVEQKSRLGQLLIKHKLISETELDAAVQEHLTSGRRLGEVLIQKGLVAERHIDILLRKQRRMRVMAAMVASLVAPFDPVHASPDLAPSTDLYTPQQQAVMTMIDRQMAVSGATNGVGAVATILQSGGEANMAVILQSGNQDVARIEQSGGSFNAAFISQQGDHQTASIVQSGNRNVALINQR